MTVDQITAIINLGAAGAVIVVVVYFLRFIQKRDEQYQVREQQWQMFFKALLADKDAPMAKLTQVIESLLTEFQEHDTWERTKLDEMSGQINRKTTPMKKV
jgi:hypothetical protein